jgi:hypothetical protein
VENKINGPTVTNAALFFGLLLVATGVFFLIAMGLARRRQGTDRKPQTRAA